MRIECIHGYFKLYERDPGDFSRFMSTFDVEISRSDDHFTFDGLLDAPDYSLPGGTFLDAPTTEVFEGNPWDVMRANELVYDFITGLVVPIATVTKRAALTSSGKFFMANGMLMPGSIRDDGSRVTDYSAHFSFYMLTFQYSEVTSG